MRNKTKSPGAPCSKLLRHIISVYVESSDGLSMSEISSVRARFNPRLIGFGIAGLTGSGIRDCASNQQTDTYKVPEDQK